MRRLDLCSPPAWGWSAFAAFLLACAAVLPTRVGMVRMHASTTIWPRCAPHPRGDGPALGVAERCPGVCSPPAWGWSDAAHRVLSGSVVLPTRVGMVRRRCLTATRQTCAPHPRGDGPNLRASCAVAVSCSPPAWGWSGPAEQNPDGGAVLPTRVGMVRLRKKLSPPSGSAPHPRGDGPALKDGVQSTVMCSPPAWGWSGAKGWCPVNSNVLPTRVGMVRRYLQRGGRRRCAPHPRGDGPAGAFIVFPFQGCSPPAWGWSVSTVPMSAPGDVLPTRVGMVRVEDD